MGVRNSRRKQAYGMGSPLQDLAPLVIQALRNPTTSDFAEIGTTWVNTSTGVIYMLGKIVANSATWQTSPASGVGTFTAVDITTGDLDVQAGASTTTISSGTVNFDNGAGLVTIANDLTVGGVTTFNGDIDISTASAYDVTATGGQDPAIIFETDGAVTETIQITNTQGTAADAIDINAAAGAILLETGTSTSAAAISLLSNFGGITVDSALALILTSDANGASAITATATAGGIDIIASGAAAGEDINITATGSSINLSATEAIATAVTIEATVGGIDVTSAASDIDISSTAASVNISAAEGVTDAIVLNASDAVGGIQLQAGTNGILIGNQVDCSVIALGDTAPTASRLITIGGGLVATASVTDQIDIAPDGATTNADSEKIVTINNGPLDTGVVQTTISSGNVTDGTHTLNLQTGNVAAGTVVTNISTGTGGKNVNIGNADGSTAVDISGGVTINTSVNANVDILIGTSTGALNIGNAAAGLIDIETAAGIAIDAATASHLTVSAAGQDLTLSSTLGSVVINAEEAIATAIQLTSAAGGVLVDSALDILLDGAAQITLDSAVAAADSIYLFASDAAGGITISSGTGDTTIDSTGAVNITADAASTIQTDGAGIDLNITSTLGRVVIGGGEAAANAVTISATNAAGGVSINAGTGEISLSSAGAVSMVPSTDTQATPTVASTINKRVFKMTFTGFTTAAAATEVFTLTNSEFVAGAGVIASVSNGGANDAQMTLSRIDSETTGTLVFYVTNNGAAALNGPVYITGWIID